MTRQLTCSRGGGTTGRCREGAAQRSAARQGTRGARPRAPPLSPQRAGRGARAHAQPDSNSISAVCNSRKRVIQLVHCAAPQYLRADVRSPEQPQPALQIPVCLPRGAAPRTFPTCNRGGGGHPGEFCCIF